MKTGTKIKNCNMKYISNFSKTFLVAALAGIFLLSCTGKPDDDEPIVEPQEVDIWLDFDVRTAYPFDLVSIIDEMGELPQTTYTGTIGDVEITVQRQEEDGKLAFTVPLLDGGDYAVVLENGKERAEGMLHILSYPTVEEPQAVIDEINGYLSNIVSDIENELSMEGQTLDPELYQLFVGFSSEYNRLMAELTDAEKMYVAQYWAANPELFSFFANDENNPFRTQSNSISKSGMTASDIFGKIRSAETKFVLFVAAMSALAGIEGVNTYNQHAPSKVVIAAAAGAALVGVLFFASKELNNLLETSIFPEEVYTFVSSMGASGTRHAMQTTTAPNNIRRQADDYDFTFYWGVPVNFNFSMSFRTLYADDINTTSPTVRNIVNAIAKLQEYRDMIDAKIIVIKSFFGFGGGLGEPAKKLENITTYKKGETLDVEPSYVSMHTGPTIELFPPLYTAVPPFFDINIWRWSDFYNNDDLFNIKMTFNLYFHTLDEYQAFQRTYSVKVIGNYLELHTPTVSNITSTSARLNGNIELFHSYAEIVEKGFRCGGVTIPCGSGPGTYSYTLNNLQCNSRYSHYAYAKIRIPAQVDLSEISTDPNARDTWFYTLNCE